MTLFKDYITAVHRSSKAGNDQKWCSSTAKFHEGLSNGLSNSGISSIHISCYWIL